MHNLAREAETCKPTTELPFTMQRGAYFTFASVSNTHIPLLKHILPQK